MKKTTEQKILEEAISALKVIRTWAAFDRDNRFTGLVLNQQSVINLADKVLNMHRRHELREQSGKKLTEDEVLAEVKRRRGG